MPNAKIDKRTISLNEPCSKIFKLFERTLKENGAFSKENKDDAPALSSVNTSPKTPVGGAVGKLKQAFEATFGFLVGGTSVDLPECHAEMDVDAHALYVAYQDYWSKLMR